MSLINDYRSTLASLKELERRVEEMQKDERLQKDLEFEGAIRGVMADFGKTEADVMAIFGVSKQAASVSVAKVRRQRTLKRYRNPHSNEVIETKGGNHKALKLWKEQYGATEVESWVES